MTQIQGKLRGDKNWTPLTDDPPASLDALEAKYRQAFFKTKYIDGNLHVINPAGNVVECEYREVKA